MKNLSKRTIVNYVLVLIWILCAFIDIHNGENYGGVIYKFFASVIFFFIATYHLLIDFGKIHPIDNKKRKWVIISAIALIFVIAFVIYGNYDIETNRYYIKSERIPKSFDGFRIAQVSDLHNAEFDKYNSTILEPIFHSHPDIIVITGDIIDSRNTDVDVAVAFAQKAVNIAPVYYINGNHESRVAKEYEILKKRLTGVGVIILENKAVDITRGDDSISLIGINDPGFRMELVDDTMEQNIAHQLMNVVPENDNYKVLLAHRPHYFDVYAGSVDLVLSGHAHGGQFKIPYVGGFVAPGQGLFPEYYEGSYTKDNAEMIVSRGIGNSIIPFRINNRPEIVIAELKTVN